MFANEYDAFVDKTDLNRKKTFEKREDISIYGLVGEMGSLASTVKRRLIAEGEGEIWSIPTDEVVEELGDSLWYWSSLTQLYGFDAESLLKDDVRYVRGNLARTSGKGVRFREAVGGARVAEFRKRARALLALERIEFDAYQKLAFLTRRTEGQILVGVCLTVLAQLGTELLRRRFPEVELEINTIVKPRDPKVILGEIAWHLSAIATAFGLTVGEVASANRLKISRRLDHSKPTPLHDLRDPSHERFPRQFDVSFVVVGRGRSRMYMNGKQLGDELSDNAYADDGYRFHDVMHLAAAANLGWSPVLRHLLGLKRKSDPKKDEVEDGARARIVEEAVLKAIHSEGERVSKPRQVATGNQDVPLFVSKNEISFRFLGFIATLTRGLQVQGNQYWEWENAILQGNDVFWKLRQEGQGTVTVDLEQRKISFCPHVYVDGAGAVVGLGTADVNEIAATDSCPGDQFDPSKEIAAKIAILNALELEAGADAVKNLWVRPYKNGVSVKADGEVRDAMWKKMIVSFRLSFSNRVGRVTCVALALT